MHRFLIVIEKAEGNYSANLENMPSSYPRLFQLQ